MNLLEAKRRVRILAEENTTRTIDNSLFDVAQKEIATTAEAIKKVFKITQGNIDNLLGDMFALEEHKATDVSYQSDSGALAYYFEVNKTATVYIEEETSTDVWTTLTTISHVGTTGEGFKAYKGLITLSVATNKCRIRFGGSFFYNYRNIALYDYAFASAGDIPDYKPYVFYTLPTDFYKFDRVVRVYDYEQYEDYADYKYENTTTNVKSIGIPIEHTGEIQIHYTAYPTSIVTATSDTYEFEIEAELQEIMLFYVTSLLKAQEDPYISSRYQNEYYTKMNNVNQQNPNQGSKKVYDSSGWL